MRHTRLDQPKRMVQAIGSYNLVGNIVVRRVMNLKSKYYGIAKVGLPYV